MNDSMRAAETRLIQLAIEKAESELRTQHNHEHISMLQIQIANLRKEESENALKVSQIQLNEVSLVVGRTKLKGSISS